MDIAYNQHSGHAKRHNRSSTNLKHLSLAPLTSRLPLADPDSLLEQPELPTQSRSAHEHHVSYLEGRSAPTTPRLLSRSNSRVNLRRSQAVLSKSKSSTHITLPSEKKTKSGAFTPTTKARIRAERDGLTLSALSNKERNDSDWLLRAGALLSSETRESKGQAWLVSRASSTSLTGQLDADDEALERELERERQSRRNSMSRRNSFAAGDADDEFSPTATRHSFDPGASGRMSRPTSRFGSRAGSRAQSRRNSRVLFTPITGLEMKGADREMDDYFDSGGNFMTEPDFVNVDEEVYDESQAAEDEVVVRRLAKTGTLGMGTWVERLMGWSLFAVEEAWEETDTETNEQTTDASEIPTPTVEKRRKGRLSEPLENEKLPPPGDEEGGWQDAAWLLSVATKVLL